MSDYLKQFKDGKLEINVKTEEEARQIEDYLCETNWISETVGYAGCHKLYYCELLYDKMKSINFPTISAQEFLGDNMKEEMTKEEIDRELESLNVAMSILEIEKGKISEQLKEIEEVEKPKFNEPYERKNNEEIHTIFLDEEYPTYEYAKQRKKEHRVHNLLKNFSDANGCDEIEEGDNVFVIKYEKKFYIDETFQPSITDIQFKSMDIAEEALRRYRKELEALR